MLVDFFSTDNIFFRNFLFSFPHESLFPRQIPGSDTMNGGLICNFYHIEAHTIV